MAQRRGKKAGWPRSREETAEAVREKLFSEVKVKKGTTQPASCEEAQGKQPSSCEHSQKLYGLGAKLQLCLLQGERT